MLPQPAERPPSRHGLVGCEGAHDAVRVGRVEVALEEAVLQALGTGGESEFRRSGRLVDVGRPFDQLVVCQRIDVRALRQMRQRLLAGSHDVARLHPGNVLHVPGSEHGEIVERSGRGLAETVQAHEIRGVHRREVAVKGAEHRNRARARLQLGAQPGQPRPAVIGLVVDRSGEAGENLIAHGLSLLRGLCLGGPEKQILGASRRDSHCQCHKGASHLGCEFHRLSSYAIPAGAGNFRRQRPLSSPSAIRRLAGRSRSGTT